METQFIHAFAGQEVESADVNLLGETSALADDRVLAELVRLLPFGGLVPVKGVIPYGLNAPAGTTPAAELAIVGKSGAGDASSHVRPFRAIVGSRTAAAVDPKAHWRDIRSAIHVGSSTLHRAVVHPATAANHRWDLIYARVDVDQDQGAITRYVKDPSTAAVTAQSIATRKATTVTIELVSGAESATPTRPALPNDSAPSYYIPLAYVFIAHPWTLASTLDARHIHEVAPCVPIAGAAGVPSIAPCNGMHKLGGALLTAVDWSAANGRPGAHVPPTMVGGAERFLGMGWAAAYDSGTPLNAITVVDDSIDWRNRIFRWDAMFTSTGHFAWQNTLAGAKVPSVLDSTPAAFGATRMQALGQSLDDDATALTGVAGGIVARVNPTILSAMAASSDVALFVRFSDGALCARVAATDPVGRLFFWISGSGPFNNVNA